MTFRLSMTKVRTTGDRLPLRTCRNNNPMRKNLLFGTLFLLVACNASREEDVNAPFLHRYHAVVEAPVDSEAPVARADRTGQNCRKASNHPKVSKCRKDLNRPKVSKCPKEWNGRKASKCRKVSNRPKEWNLRKALILTGNSTARTARNALRMEMAKVDRTGTIAKTDSEIYEPSPLWGEGGRRPDEGHVSELNYLAKHRQQIIGFAAFCIG